MAGDACAHQQHAEDAYISNRDDRTPCVETDTGLGGLVDGGVAEKPALIKRGAYMRLGKTER